MRIIARRASSLFSLFLSLRALLFAACVFLFLSNFKTIQPSLIIMKTWFLSWIAAALYVVGAAAKVSEGSLRGASDDTTRIIATPERQPSTGDSSANLNQQADELDKEKNVKDATIDHHHHHHLELLLRQRNMTTRDRSLFLFPSPDELFGLDLGTYMEAVDVMLDQESGPKYTIFGNLIAAAGMTETVRDLSLTQTIFAPDNSAFNPELEAFLLDPVNHEVLVQTVQYHLIPDLFNYLVFNMMTLQQSRTLQLATSQGSTMDISVSADGLFINDDTRIHSFMFTNQAILYRIKRVLVPPAVQHLIPESLFEQYTDDSASTNVGFELPILLTLLDIFLPLQESSVSDYPSLVPSDAPSTVPSGFPSLVPSDVPSTVPSGSQPLVPSDAPSTVPSDTPSLVPSDTPSTVPLDFSDSLGTSEVDFGLVGGTDPSLLDMIAERNNLFWFLYLVEVAGYMRALVGHGPWTVFAPQNEAFATFDRDYLLLLLTEPAYRLHALEIVQFHFCERVYSSSNLVVGQELDTLIQSFGTVMVSEDEDGLFLETSTAPGVPVRIIEADIFASNGVLHVMDDVMLPGFTNLNPWNFLIVSQFQGNTETLSFLNLVVASGYDHILEISEDITFFAPVNNGIPTQMFEFLLAVENESILIQVMEYHMLMQVINFETLAPSTLTTFTTEQGESLSMAHSDDGVFSVNDAVVCFCIDLPVVHVFQFKLSILC